MSDATLSEKLNEATLRTIRKEIGDLQTLTIGLVASVRHVERNLNELKDDLEVMFKAEIIGFRAHIETSFDERFARIEEGLDARFVHLENLLKDNKNDDR
ncbi:MAG TPA: hypothetical protein VK602_00765 [Phyllobacterium sp.]|nr:hypothetical protein [Phyllobacterium sp.]